MRTEREPRPFSFDALPRVARARLPWLRKAGRALKGFDPVPLAIEVEVLLGAPATITPSPLELCAAGALASAVQDPLVAVILEASDGTLGSRVAVELDPHGAARVADRALGGTGGDTIAPPTSPLDDGERGALAYVAARLVAAAGLPFVVRDVVTDQAGLSEAIGDDGSAVLPAAIDIGGDAGFGRLWLPERLLDAGASRVGHHGGGHIAKLPLELVVEAAWGVIHEAELAGLEPGDAVIADESWLHADPRGWGGGWAGRLRAQIAGASRLAMACVVEDSALRIESIDVGVGAGTREGSRMNGETTETALERAGDAPLDISVEIARFTLPLEDVAALAPGEVLATGRAIGEHATLRIGGKAIAEGELVDVDGEIGIRILRIPR